MPFVRGRQGRNNPFLEACFEARGDLYSGHFRPIREEEYDMNKWFADIIVRSNRINRQHIQLLVAIVTLAMLVVGIGAPARGGGV